MFQIYRPKKSKILPILLVVIFAVIITAAAYYYYESNYPASKNPRPVEFVVEQGQGSLEIGQNLKKAELIRNPLFFEFYAWKTGQDDKLQTGEYKIPGNLSLKDIIKLLTAVNIIEEDLVRIIEGWTLKDIGEYLEKKELTTYEDFLQAVQFKQGWWTEYDFLVSKPRDVDLEGYLFPDTYRIYKGTTLQDVLVKMLDNFDKKLTAELRAEIEKSGRTLHEVLTMASILEKEVNTYEDRRTVAGIFYKRIEIGMPLQSDSTVNYVTGVDVSRNARDNLDLDSPYNSYKYRGLPPGPICNPGLSAIKAAIYPNKTSYLYFLTTPDGTVIYSRTHDEHVAAKAIYYP